MATDEQFEARYLDLIDRNRGRIDRLCRAWSRTSADRDDLRSEVWLQLWRSLPSFDGRASEDTWLYRVTLNVAMMFGRREHGRRRRAEAWEPSPPPERTPPEHLEQRERVDRLMRVVAGLETDDRALATMVLEGLPYARIAEVVGITENNVGVRVHRLKKKLARLMTEAREVPRGRP